MVNKFKKDFEWAKGKNIFLYGVGHKTSILLKELNSFNIVGLIDKNVENIGKTIYGVKVYDIKEVENYKEVVIIIVASNIYYKTILLRIKKYLEFPNVEIYYYTGEKAEMLPEKKINPYKDIEVSKLYKEIDRNDVVSFDLFDTLIMRKTLYPLYNSNLLDEFKYCIVREDVFDAFNYAKKVNKKVLITTDMYLGKNEIEQLLNKLNITGYDELLVSAELHKNKNDGSMYEYITNKFDKRILHIGDNYNNDIIKAREFGINTFFLPNGVELLGESSISSLLEFNNNEVGLGLVTAKLFNSPFALKNNDNTISIENLFDFGYIVFGPLICGYLINLTKRVKKENVNNIAFLARDGFMLKELYEFFINLFNIKIDARTVYLKISSRLMESVMLFNENDIYSLIDNREFDGTFAELCKIIFDINISNSDEHYFNEIVTKLDKDKIKLWLKPYIPVILKQSEINRKNYLEYLKLVSLDEKSMIVDIGYTGRQQYYLEKLLKMKFSGYYLSLENDTKFNNGKMEGFYDYKISSMFKILEAVCVSDEGSYIRAIGGENFYNEKKCKNQEFYNEKLKIIEGIKAYLTDIKDIYCSFEQIEDLKELSEKIFNIAFSENVNLSNDISDILFFDNPYSSAKETKII